LFGVYRLIKQNTELTHAFRRRLIEENSRRFLFLLLPVGLSQIVFALLEVLQVWPCQDGIFLIRVVIFSLCVVFMVLIRFFGRNTADERALGALAAVTSLIQVISVLAGCFFVFYMFKQGIPSYSAFLLVAFIVSLTCVRNPYYSGVGLLVIFAGLTGFLAWTVGGIAVWIGEFLIAFVFVLALYFGGILNYGRHLKLFIKENEVIRANVLLENMSQTDQLTGLFNRRKITEAIEQAIAYAKRYDHCFCLAVLDIDHFKRVNDQFGHVAGDKLLNQFADLLKQTLRVSDVIGRWGGEEFLILIPSCTEAGAYAFIERLRTTVAEHVFEGVGSITFSAGICLYGNEYTFAELVEKADQAMYLAKDKGRNQTQVYRHDAT
jgi:diguanylate cyclase (GGDEF)-like protein